MSIVSQSMKKLEQIELQLSNEDPEIRIDALFDAYECGEVGIGLVARVLKDKNRKVRQAALMLLAESEIEITKQALWNYLPFSKMQCLRAVTEFKFNSFDTEGLDPDYFAIADRYNSIARHKGI